MARREILEYPDPRLKATSAAVDLFDDTVGELADDLIDTLYTTEAIALSAPQVDDHRRLLVMDLSGTKSAPQVYVNPEIIARRAWGFVEESCLSVPGVVGNVLRATEVYVRAQDARGGSFERSLSGMEAVCLQHEMDHLTGKLFIDRMSIFRRMSVRAKARSRARARENETA